MKLGQLGEYNVTNIFLQNYGENKAGRLVPDLVFFKKKLYMKQKPVVSTLVSVCFVSSRLGHTTKANCMKLLNVDSEICSSFIFQKTV